MAITFLRFFRNGRHKCDKNQNEDDVFIVVLEFYLPNFVSVRMPPPCSTDSLHFFSPSDLVQTRRSRNNSIHFK